MTRKRQPATVRIPDSEIPPRPAWLLPAAAAEWDRLLPGLVARGVLTPVDWSMFAAFCQSYAHWRAAEEFMAVNGTVMVLRDDKGNVKGSMTVPQFGIAQKSLEKMRAFAVELGLTPRSRTKPKRAEAASASPMSAMLSSLARGG